MYLSDLERAGCPADPTPESLERLARAYAADPSLKNRDNLIMALAIPVYNVARKFRGSRHGDEIVGIVNVALVEGVARWRDVAVDFNVRRYVEFVARRRIRVFLQKERESKTFSIRPDEGVGRDTQRDADAVIDFHGKLDDEGRRIVELLIAGRSVAEIADLIEVSKPTAYNRIHAIEEYLSPYQLPW